jgi:phosphatidate cytidylyltransferase
LDQADPLPQPAAPQAGAQPRTILPPKPGVLTLRIASALVMGPLALAAVWFGTPVLPVLVALAAAGMGREWARLSGATAAAPTSITMATALAAVAAVSLGAPIVAMLLAVLGAIAVGVAALVTKSCAPGWTAGGTLWFVLPCIALLWIATGPHGRAAIFFLLAVVWASDIGAYAAGRVIGGPRLAPTLSPNKTWAGACGGLLGSALVGLGAARLMGGSGAVLVAASLVLSVAAQLGDLAESFAKRKFGVKDSGSLIPGHGGLLDRLDSLLTAAALPGVLLLLGAGAALGWSP